MDYSLSQLISQALGIAGGLYVAFMILRPTSKLDFLIRGSVGLITGYVFTSTIAQKFELEIMPSAFIASCGAWPVIGFCICYAPTRNI